MEGSQIDGKFQLNEELMEELRMRGISTKEYLQQL